jgi:hypothetical protein
MDQPGEKRGIADVAHAARPKEIAELGGAGEGIGEGPENGQKRKRADTAREPIIGGCGGFFRRSPEEVGKRLRFEYIHDHTKDAETALYCRILGVTSQGYAKYVKNLMKCSNGASLRVWWL